jgi:hypothetical protein
MDKDWGTSVNMHAILNRSLPLERTVLQDSAGDFKLLAYRIIKPEDGLTTGTGSSLCSIPGLP